MDTRAIDCILKQNNAFQPNFNVREAQNLSSETNESLESDQETYSVNVTKINTLSSSIDSSLQSSYNQTNRLDNQIQFEEFELDDSLNNEISDIILSNSSQVDQKNKGKQVSTAVAGRVGCLLDEQNQIIEDQSKDIQFTKHNQVQANQKQFLKKSNIQDEKDKLDNQNIKVDPAIENIQLKKEIESLSFTLKQQEKENFYLHQNIKTLKEELYGQKTLAQKKSFHEDQNHFFQDNSNHSKNQNALNKSYENSSLKNSAEKKQINLQQKHDQEATSSTQINMLNEQMHVLRNEMSTMKEMYLAKLKEQTFLVETLTKKLGEKDEFIQKMKNSYINSLNQSKNSQLIQSQIYQNSANQQQSSHLLQESCISEINKPISIQQSLISQQHCLQQQQQGQLQQHFNNTFDQVKLSQEFEQLRRDIKFSTIGNISPFLRDEKGGGIREDLLSTASNLQQGPNSSSNNSNYCNQSTNNYSKNHIQQQSPFNQSKYHNLSHMSNLSNRGFSNEFNPNTSINGNIVQHNSSQIHQQNQGSSSNINIANQTGMNCNNSTTTHLTSTSINSNNMNSNINNSHPGRNKADLLNQKRNSSFTNSSANASNNLNQSLNHQTQNTNNQNANNSILQFTPVSNKHLNQSNSGSQQNNQTMNSQNTQTQTQQTQKQQQITLDFRLTFNQNELFNATQTQQQQFAILSQQDSQNTTNPPNNDHYIHDVEDSNNSHHFTNKQTQLASQINSHQKQNPQPLQANSNQQRNQFQNNNNNNLLSIILDSENQTNDQKPKSNSKEAYIYSTNYLKNINETDNHNNLSNCSNNFPLSTKVQNTNSSLANKSLKEQLMNQQILQQKKQQILQNQQQQTYQNLIVKSNNQDLLKNLKKQSGTNQNQNQQLSQQNQSSPKKQQSRSYHISSNQNQNGSNSKAQQTSLQQQIQNAANPSIQYQEYIPKINNNYNQMINQNSTKNRKQNTTIIAQGLNSCVSHLQDNTIPSSTMSVNSNFSNNLPIFRSINNEQQNHNSSCNSNQNSYNPNNNSFKFLNGKSNVNSNNNNIPSQNNPSTTLSNVNQSQVEKKRFLQTTQISSSHNNQTASNKFSMIASPGKYSNSNSEQKQLFLRTQQIYPTSQNNNNNNNNNHNNCSQQRQKSLAIPSQLSTNNTNQAQQSSLKVPMSAGGARKNNSLCINSQNTCNNTNLMPTNFNATTAHSTTSSHSSTYQKGLQDLFKFNQNEKQKKLNDFFSKTLQVRPGELKNLNENLGCYSNSKNAAKLIQQMEFSSLDDVEIQLDDLQILSNQIKEVLQNDPLKKNTEDRIQKVNQLNSGVRQSGGISSQIQQQQQPLQNNNRSQSENHNYQNLQQQFQLHQQLNNCLNSQTVNVQSQYTTNPNKKIGVKSYDCGQNMQICPEDQQAQLQHNNYVASNTTNQRVRPPKNNNFIFNENNKFIPCPSAQNPSGASTTSSATQHSRNYSANNMNNNNNSNLKNSNYKIHRKHLTLLNTDDISSKNQGNYAQSEISTQKAAFSDIHNFQNNNQNQYHQLY
ncbi:hypothetical protein ABPG74_017996 [Tetrahymena malaccensis]